MWSRQVWKICLFHLRWCCGVLPRFGVFFHVLEYCKWWCGNWAPVNSRLAAYLDYQRCDANVSSYFRCPHTMKLPSSSCKVGGVCTQRYSLGWPEKNCLSFLSKTVVVLVCPSGDDCLASRDLRPLPAWLGCSATSQPELEGHSQRLRECCHFPSCDGVTSTRNEE